jgi:hypothetical protein
MARVFISYSHDSDAHKGRVRALADELRRQNLDVIIDQYLLPAGPAEGWPYWSEAQVREADYVLVASTEAYCRRYEARETPGIGLGAVCEARLIHQLLYNVAGINHKFRVILFTESDNAHIPDTLQGYHRFSLPQAHPDLLAWLTGQTSQMPPVGGPAPSIAWPSSASYLWDMADRKEVTARLEKMLTGQSAQRILLLGAESNSGKTLLLAQLKAYAQNLQLENSLLDCKGSITLDDLFQLMFLDLPGIWQSSRSSTASARSYAVIQDLRQVGKPVLLMFDTYEKASDDTRKWIENQLLPRLPAGVAVVIAGQAVPERAKQPWANLADHVQLQPIQKAADWLEYGQRKWQGSRLTLDHVEALTLATNGKAGLIAALLETMMTTMRSGAGA